MLSALMVLMSAFASHDIIALDNGAIRVEIDPRWFNIRFVGVPGGENFLDPVFRGERPERDSTADRRDGLTTAIYPFLDDPVSKEARAEVADVGPHHAVLVGPLSTATGLRIKKEIRLGDTEPRAVFIVTVLSERQEPVEIAVHNIARVPMGTTLRPAVGIDPLQVIESPAPLLLDLNGLKSAAVPLAEVPGRVVLGALTESLFHVRGDLTWSRQSMTNYQQESKYIDNRNVVLTLDQTSYSYTANLVSSTAKVSAASPLVSRESWEIIPLKLPKPATAAPTQSTQAKPHD